MAVTCARHCGGAGGGQQVGGRQLVEKAYLSDKSGMRGASLCPQLRA